MDYNASPTTPNGQLRSHSVVKDTNSVSIIPVQTGLFDSTLLQLQDIHFCNQHKSQLERTFLDFLKGGSQSGTNSVQLTQARNKDLRNHTSFVGHSFGLPRFFGETTIGKKFVPQKPN